MALHLNVNDRAEMKRWGDAIRAFYINPHGVPFHKDFRNADEMETFNDAAREAGTTVLGYVGL